MGKNFEYKPALVQETRNEITYVTSLVSTYSNKFSTSPTTLFASLSPKLQAKCSGAVFTKMNSFGNTMNDISNVGKFIDESEAKIIRELISNGQFESQLSEWISNNEVGTDQLISIGKLYYDSIYELYGNNYKKGLRQVLYPYTALIEAGLSEDIVANIGNGFLQDLANKDLMYTKEGVVYAHKAFTGLMAMFGLRLGYKMVTVNYFDNDQFYLGDKEHQLNATVCTSYVQFLYRCAGLDAVSTDSGATPSNLWSCYGAVYNNDGTIDYRRTFASEYSKGNPKYVSGDAGDVLFNGTHVMMVMENTGEGYIVAENGGGAQTSYYTYGKLASMGYSISDMSSMFDNTSKLSIIHQVFMILILKPCLIKAAMELIYLLHHRHMLINLMFQKKHCKKYLNNLIAEIEMV